MIIKANPTPLVRPATYFLSNTNLAANTPATIVAPGSNLNGIIVWLAELNASFAAGSYMALMWANAAPASITGGNAILTQFNSAQVTMPSRLAIPVFIPPGQGLYIIATLAMTAHYSTVGYTVL